MKAFEWVGKFKSVSSDVPVEERYADVLKEFATELSELVALRTKTSRPESKYGAAEGAIREQKSKFRSICSSIGDLNDNLFDKLLEAAVPDLAKWKAAMVKDEKKATVDDVKEYRRTRGR